MDDQTLSAVTGPTAPRQPPHQKRNRIAIAIAALIGILILVELFLGFQDSTLKIPYFVEPTGVAKVSSIEGDARYQPSAEKSWFEAKVTADVFSGDAIYSGSRTNVGVEMKSGGQLSLGEETLVIFDSIDGVTIPDLARGNIKLRISGDMKISISGDVSEFSPGAAGESEILISIDEDSKGKIQVLSGTPRIKAPKQTSKLVEPGTVIDFLARKFRLSSRKQIELPSDITPLPRKVPIEDTARIVPLPVATPPVVFENPAPIELQTQIVHTLTKADLYEQAAGVRLRPLRGLKFVNSAGVLKWTGGNGTKTFIQITKVKSNQKPNFEDCWYNEGAPGQDVVISKWRAGRSAWRVSLDGINWSKSAEVLVTARFSTGREPVLVVENPVVELPNPVVRMRLEDQSGRKMSGWIIEGGRDRSFNKSVSVWASESKLMVPVSKLGNYFFRVRSVDEHGEVSAFSNVNQVTVKKAKRVPIRIAKKANDPKPEREVATAPEPENSQSVTKTEIEFPSISRSFQRSGPWGISILGGVGAVISIVQTEAGVAPPVLQVLGLGASYFDGRYEAMVNYRSRIGVSGGVSGSAPTVSRLDLRGGHWWNMGWRPFSTLIRLGLVVGYENYQNYDSRDFSPFYEVVKGGFGVNVDLTERIQTGGTVLFGTWTNSNSVTEVDGYVAYDFFKNLNLGIGYRIGLFEAGTITSSPTYLPYREATGEAYSQLKFSF